MGKCLSKQGGTKGEKPDTAPYTPKKAKSADGGKAREPVSTQDSQDTQVKGVSSPATKSEPINIPDRPATSPTHDSVSYDLIWFELFYITLDTRSSNYEERQRFIMQADFLNMIECVPYIYMYISAQCSVFANCSFVDLCILNLNIESLDYLHISAKAWSLTQSDHYCLSLGTVTVTKDRH